MCSIISDLELSLIRSYGVIAITEECAVPVPDLVLQLLHMPEPVSSHEIARTFFLDDFMINYSCHTCFI